MRFVYVILIGMILFNGVIIVTAPLFPLQTSGINASADDVTTTYSGYSNINAIDVIIKTLIEGGFVFGIATVLAILTRNPVFIGVGAFVGIFVGLWGSISEPIHSTLSEYSTYGVGFYDLFMIVFGIIIVLSVVEILSGQQGVDT